MRVLSLGYSPCPNDTHIFYPLISGRISLPNLTFSERLEDVETLNILARKRSLDVTKISCHALGHLRHDYALLRSGGALGRGCGPLVVARPGFSLKSLANGIVAIPGQLTTANLLLQLYNDSILDLRVMPFHRILPAITNGLVDAGLLIHEARFTYQDLGLVCLVDLGQWWEEQTGLPIPLGGILARRSLGPEIIENIEEGIRASVVYAGLHPDETRAYVRQHAQELNDEVIRNHIALYVNDFSQDLGEEGLAAMMELLGRAESRHLIPRYSGPLLAK